MWQDNHAPREWSQSYHPLFYHSHTILLYTVIPMSILCAVLTQAHDLMCNVKSNCKTNDYMKIICWNFSKPAGSHHSVHTVRIWNSWTVRGESHWVLRWRQYWGEFILLSNKVKEKGKEFSSWRLSYHYVVWKGTNACIFIPRYTMPFTNHLNSPCLRDTPSSVTWRWGAKLS